MHSQKNTKDTLTLWYATSEDWLIVFKLRPWTPSKIVDCLRVKSPWRGSAHPPRNCCTPYSKCVHVIQTCVLSVHQNHATAAPSESSVGCSWCSENTCHFALFFSRSYGNTHALLIANKSGYCSGGAQRSFVCMCFLWLCAAAKKRVLCLANGVRLSHDEKDLSIFIAKK